MRILFLTVISITDLNIHGLYQDLLNEFVQNGHDVTIVCPQEKNSEQGTELVKKEGYTLLKVDTNNFQKTSFIKKGIATLLINGQFKRAVDQKLKDFNYDLIMYSTPPVTIAPVIGYLKQKTGAKTLLLLKDIWPQGVVDIGGIRFGGLIWRYFRGKEKKLYRLSDWIGCTSPANIEFIKTHNTISAEKLMLITNGLSGELIEKSNRDEILEKYDIPTNKKVFFYGGNLGLPQDISFLVQCLKQCKDNCGIHFLICGQGTHRHLLEQYCRDESPENLTILNYLSQADYEEVVSAVDVCMLFLNRKFTVPHCPARFYTYMKHGKPVLACTDCTTDIREDIEQGEFGWWCESRETKDFVELIEKACESNLQELGENSRAWFEKHYTTALSYERILSKIGCEEEIEGLHPVHS